MERWKAVKGLEGRYEVSDQGRVKSLARYAPCVGKDGMPFLRLTKTRILKQGDCRGYKLVNLPRLDGKHGFKVAKVHFLVAQAFVEGKGTSVNHKNGIKHDNVWTNLEWATQLEQLLHMVETGLNKQCIKVIGTRLSDGERFEFLSQRAAAKAVTGYATNSTHIRQVLAGERQHAFGYRWERSE